MLALRLYSPSLRADRGFRARLLSICKAQARPTCARPALLPCRCFKQTPRGGTRCGTSARMQRPRRFGTESLGTWRGGRAARQRQRRVAAPRAARGTTAGGPPLCEAKPRWLTSLPTLTLPSVTVPLDCYKLLQKYRHNVCRKERVHRDVRPSFVRECREGTSIANKHTWLRSRYGGAHGQYAIRSAFFARDRWTAERWYKGPRCGWGSRRAKGVAAAHGEALRAQNWTAQSAAAPAGRPSAGAASSKVSAARSAS